MKSSTRELRAEAEARARELRASMRARSRELRAEARVRADELKTDVVSRLEAMKSDVKARAPLGYLIHEVARLMKRRFEDEARMNGITMPQWRALAQIGVNDGISQATLAACIDADPMTVSGILDRLEKRGLIDRYPDPNDSRAKLARLTDEGLWVFKAARDVGTAMYEAALVGIDEDDRAIAESVLKRMRDNLSGQVAENEQTEDFAK
jgi:DNA-binding MarR family transcriptional regulator